MAGHSSRNVIVLHQILSLTEIDFSKKSIRGYTELTLMPTDEKILRINLNCKQCKIYSIYFNGIYEAEFEYYDPSLIKFYGTESKKDLNTYLAQEELATVSVDADEGNGELAIRIPEELQKEMDTDKKFTFKLALEFGLEDPKGGIRFLTSSQTETKPGSSINAENGEKIQIDGEPLQSASTSNQDMYLCSVDHNAHYWFPCVFSTNELSTWKLEITVDKEYNVIASGDLIEVEAVKSLNPPAKNGVTNMETSLVGKSNTSHVLADITNEKMDGSVRPGLNAATSMVDGSAESFSARTFHYYLSKPTCAHNIGICIGKFKQIIERAPPASNNQLSTDDLIVKYYYLNSETYDSSSLKFDYLNEDADDYQQPPQQDQNEDEVKNSLDKFIAKFIKQKPIRELVDYFKELLSFKYPHRYYKQVFLDDTSFLHAENDKNNSLLSFTTFTILNINSLHTNKIIDKTLDVKHLQALCIAQQYFGCYILPSLYNDYWFVNGISYYLAGLYFRKMFGNNEYKHIFYKYNQEIIEFEKEKGFIILDPNSVYILNNCYNGLFEMTPTVPQVGTIGVSSGVHNNYNKFNLFMKNLKATSANYAEMESKKAHMVLKFIEDCLGRDLLLKLLNYQLQMADNMVFDLFDQEKIYDLDYLTESDNSHDESNFNDSKESVDKPDGENKENQKENGLNGEEKPTDTIESIKERAFKKINRCRKKLNLYLTSSVEKLTKLLNLMNENADQNEDNADNANQPSVPQDTRTTEQIIKELNNVIDNWVYKLGCVRLNCSYQFNRKKNTLEVELKQELIVNSLTSSLALTNTHPSLNTRRYVGPLTIIIQEIDGSFMHNLNIDENIGTTTSSSLSSSTAAALAASVATGTTATVGAAAGTAAGAVGMTTTVTSATSTRFDIVCHSKGKKTKKKKIPLLTGEEVDIDTSQMDMDSPVLWIRIDPDLKLLREINLEQPDHNWFNQLKFEREIYSQLMCMDILAEKYYGSKNFNLKEALLASFIENNDCYYRVRIQAAHRLAKTIANQLKMEQQQQLSQFEFSQLQLQYQQQQIPIVQTFRKLFMTQSIQAIQQQQQSQVDALATSSNGILTDDMIGGMAQVNSSVTPNTNVINRNNFSDPQLYFIQKNFPLAIAQLRTFLFAASKQSLQHLTQQQQMQVVFSNEIVRFLVDLLRYNENSKNNFSDSCYRAALIEALGSVLVGQAATPSTPHVWKTELATARTQIIEEIVLRMNLDKILPTYRFVITKSCLQALRSLQKSTNLPKNMDLFKEYTQKFTFIDLRLCAMEICCEYLSSQTNLESNKEEDESLFDYLLQHIESADGSDAFSSTVKLALARHFTKYLPFKSNMEESCLNREAFANRLWNLINNDPNVIFNDSLRATLMDLYFQVYGFNKPKCVKQKLETVADLGSIEAVNF